MAQTAPPGTGTSELLDSAKTMAALLRVGGGIGKGLLSSSRVAASCFAYGGAAEACTSRAARFHRECSALYSVPTTSSSSSGREDSRGQADWRSSGSAQWAAAPLYHPSRQPFGRIGGYRSIDARFYVTGEKERGGEDARPAPETSSGSTASNPFVRAEGPGAEKPAAAPAPTSKLEMIQKYGVTFMMCWGALYCVPLAGIYGALSTGVIGGADAIQVLKYVGIDKLGIDITLINPTFGNVALSYGINEVLEVVRLPVAVAITPMVAKMLGRRANAAPGGGDQSAGGGDKPVGKLAMEAKTNKKIEMIKQYGFTFLGWWTLLWAISWGVLYTALDNGLMGGQDGMELVAQIPYLDNFVDLSQLKSDTTK